MDTQITPRRSIPTELKPRLRYVRSVCGTAFYQWPYTEHNNANSLQIKAVSKIFGIPFVGSRGYIFKIDQAKP